MARKQFGMKLDEDLMAAVDEAVALSGASRTSFIEGAVRVALGRSVPGPVVEAPARELPPPPKPRKYTEAELARKRAQYARLGWKLADFSEREAEIER